MRQDSETNIMVLNIALMAYGIYIAVYCETLHCSASYIVNKKVYYHKQIVREHSCHKNYRPGQMVYTVKCSSNIV